MPRVKAARTPAPVASKTRWQPPGLAANLLDVSSSKLAGLRKSGAMKQGTHYRDISPPGAGRATYQYHVANCEKMLNQGMQAIGPARSAIAAGGRRCASHGAKSPDAE
ncbi:MAG: hypothetical protein ACFB4J_18825 [Elainellaceae cyanobacterium]